MISQPRIFSIEGNIGAGKTTVIDNLQKYLEDDKDIIFLREPVDIWQSIHDESGESILSKFYGDPEKYAFSFQVMAFVTRLSLLRKTLKENPKCKVIICERSLEADRNIFAKMLFDDKLIENINYNIYLKFYQEYRNDFVLHRTIYIDADAEICHKRVSQRARDGEEGVSLDYLKNCQKYHNEWLCNDEMKDKVLQIKTNEDVLYDFENPDDMGIVWLKTIKEYIYENIPENNHEDSGNELKFTWVKNVIDNVNLLW